MQYRSIPINERLPVGTLEPEDTEEDSTSSHKVVHTEELQSAVSKVDEEENHDDDDTFGSVLIPLEEGLPCNSNDIVSVLMSKEAIIKARAERNNALSLAKHYRDVAETLKLEINTFRRKWRVASLILKNKQLLMSVI